MSFFEWSVNNILAPVFLIFLYWFSCQGGQEGIWFICRRGCSVYDAKELHAQKDVTCRSYEEIVTVIVIVLCVICTAEVLLNFSAVI